MVTNVQSSLSAPSCPWERFQRLRMLIFVFSLLVLQSPTTVCQAVFAYEAIYEDARTINDYKSDTVDRQQTFVGTTVIENDPATVGRMSIANMTCDTFLQPLDHFVPRGRSPAYEERYCTYYGYADQAATTSPIFFYTGNESPLEQYINQVGFAVPRGFFHCIS